MSEVIESGKAKDIGVLSLDYKVLSDFDEYEMLYHLVI